MIYWTFVLKIRVWKTVSGGYLSAHIRLFLLAETGQVTWIESPHWTSQIKIGGKCSTAFLFKLC